MNQKLIYKRDFNVTLTFLAIYFIASSLDIAFIKNPESSELDVISYLRFTIFLLFLGRLFFNYSNYSPFIKNNKVFTGLIVFFLLIIISQFFIDLSLKQLQGNIKFILFFLAIILSLGHCYFDPENALKTIGNWALFFLICVLIFYPYLILSSGETILQRLLTPNSRYGFFLGHANADAHLIVTTSFLIIFSILYKHSKAFSFLFVCICIALIYNGTRAALILFILLNLICFSFLSKRKIFLYFFIFLFLIIIFIVSPLQKIININFQNEYIFTNVTSVLQGEHVGGNFSYRVADIWVPIFDHVVKNSLWFGYGSNGWDVLSSDILGHRIPSHNFFIWSFANWGLLGVLFFIVLIIHYLIISFKTLNTKNKSHKKISISIFCSWIGFINWTIFENPFSPQGFTVLTLLILATTANKYLHLKSFESKV